MEQFKIELIMSEFGAIRQNAGKARLGEYSRLNPTADAFRKLYPTSKITLYTDQPFEDLCGVDVVNVIPPFDPTEERYGWRAHDYYQAYGLLNSTADIAIAMDSDMLIVSDNFKAICQFATIFGMALPINPRLLLKIDGGIGLDSTYQIEADITQGLGVTYNLTPIAFKTSHSLARQFLNEYCLRMLNNPGRGAVHLAQTSYVLCYQPYILPPQWCVCSPRDLDSKHIWSNAIVLHLGHADVLPTWKRKKLIKMIISFTKKIIKKIGY